MGEFCSDPNNHFFYLVGNEENAVRQNGEFIESRLRCSRSLLYKAMLATWRYGYILDKIFRNRGNYLVIGN